MSGMSLRIVTFSGQPMAYELVKGWIRKAGYTHSLAVMPPGQNGVPPDVDLLVTKRLRRVATPLLKALQPDLLVSFTFPYRITPELCAIPRYGAVNLHPTVLPAYRGPNVMRPLYEGYPLFGATLHWITEEYDQGNILSQRSASLPDDVQAENIYPLWAKMLLETLAEGVERAVAGDEGIAQDESFASYAAPFTKEDGWLNLREPGRTIQRKVTALNMDEIGGAKVMIDSTAYRVWSVALEQREGYWEVEAGDGPIYIQGMPISDNLL